ncbi:MAG: cadherin-like beta sandwich domain-containing protein [Agathobacter sp.]|nr:cadherin-like beta sandwich domain-containing protein [Agathobacter sp.]
MKRVLSSFLCIASMLFVLLGNGVETYYANTGVSLSVSASTVNIGDEVSVTVSIPNDYSATIDLVFPKDLLSYESASVSANNIGTTQLSNGRINLNLSDIMNLTSVTLKFKATLEGSANITAEVIKAGNNITEETVSWSSASKAIVVQKPAPPASETPQVPQKSDDNALASLKLSNATLSPAFKGNVTKYTSTVSYDVSQVVVSAKTSSSKAIIESVTGNGTVNLNVGENVIKIVVKAENGTKATYTIVVTRKAKDTTTPQPSESESTSQTESENTEVNELLQWQGEQLQPVDKIPNDSIPADFESKLLVVNGQQMQGLSFTKGDLKVLYLNNTNGAGSLYVYDEALETIYPFIKLTSEKNYVMVLLPDEQNAPAPAGFESCTFSIEGKGIISAYQLKETTPADTEAVEDSTMTWNLFGAETFYAAEPKISDFYLIYCMNDDGEKGWYMYDSVEGTFQRYLATAPSLQAGGAPSDDAELGDKYAELEKELNAAKKTQYIIIAVAAAIIVILIVLLVVLCLKNRSNEDDGYWDEVDDVEEDDDDEIEIEFYNMEEAIVEQTEKTEETEKAVESEKAEPTVKVDSKNEENDDETDLEFIDFE